MSENVHQSPGGLNYKEAADWLLNSSYFLSQLTGVMTALPPMTFVSTNNLATNGVVVVPMAIACTIAHIDIVNSGFTNGLLEIFNAADLNTDSFILERDLAGVAIPLAIPVFARTTGGSLWLRITNFGATSNQPTTINYTPFVI